MKSTEIRQKFLKFFEERGHKVISSAPLIPEGDSSTLFITAGMQPLVPYLLGESHPEGKRLVNVQKSLRTGDIDEVGDNTHLTFFEMLGNWSLGDYWKEDAIKWSHELLTKEFNLDPNRLYITCFEGDDNAPKDEESAEIWKSLGIPESRIYFLGKEDNWWSAGENGPSGPDTEMFYDLIGSLGEMSKEEFLKASDEGKVVEIWNDVFMEYETKDGKVVGKLPQRNVDTGAGLERLATVLQGKENVYETDLFSPILEALPEGDEKARRIIVDHLRAAIFAIADGVEPSNKEEGSVLRNLIRRAVKNFYILGTRGVVEIQAKIFEIINGIFSIYNNYIPDSDRQKIRSILMGEIISFEESLDKKNKILNKFENYLAGKGKSPIKARIYIPGKPMKHSTPFISGLEAFEMYTTHGVPIEDIKYLAKKLNYVLDEEAFDEEIKRHKKISKSGVRKKFKGGLRDTSEESLKYHTATHLLNKALKVVLGDHIEQKGSNITPERLRFDFSHPDKLTDEEIQKIEDLVNKKIKEALPVSYEEMSLEEAKDIGAEGVFGEKYGERVKVYKIGDFSTEICGGPHVKNTSELGTFKITKETSSSAGVRRIKAILE